MTKTVQLGIRIEKKLVDRIEELAKNEGIDRNMWIKRALADIVQDEEDGMADAAIEDYIHLRIDEKTLLKFTEFKEVPEDIKQSRQIKLKGILEVQNGKNIHK